MWLAVARSSVPHGELREVDKDEARGPKGLPICQACVEERDRRLSGMKGMNLPGSRSRSADSGHIWPQVAQVQAGVARRRYSMVPAVISVGTPNR